MYILEILITFVLASIIISSATALASAEQNLQISNYQYTTATELAKRAIDLARQKSLTDFSASFSSTTYDTIFQTTLTENIINPYTKEITATVSWNKPSGQTLKTELVTRISDWASLVNGNTCALAGNWTQPYIKGQLSFDNTLTDIKVVGKYAYITGNGPVASLPDLFVVDLSITGAPVVVAQLNTGPGLNSIEIVGQYAYAGNTSINGQLQILDISNPLQPSLVKSYKIPGNYNDNTTIPNTVVYSNDKIYLGTQKSQISELHIIDVSNRLTPTEVGTREITAGIFSMKLRGSKLYMASADYTEFSIWDVSDPTHPRQQGGLNSSDGRGKSLALMGNYTFFGRTQGGNELYIFDDSNGLSIWGQYRLETSIYSMTASQGLLFMGTNDTTKAVQIWNVSNPSTAFIIGEQDIDGKATTIRCGVNSLYVLGEDPNALYIIGK